MIGLKCKKYIINKELLKASSYKQLARKSPQFQLKCTSSKEDAVVVVVNDSTNVEYWITNEQQNHNTVYFLIFMECTLLTLLVNSPEVILYGFLTTTMKDL